MKIEITIETAKDMHPSELLDLMVKHISEMSDETRIDQSSSWYPDQTTQLSIRRDDFLTGQNPYIR